MSTIISDNSKAYTKALYKRLLGQCSSFVEPDSPTNIYSPYYVCPPVQEQRPVQESLLNEKVAAANVIEGHETDIGMMEEDAGVVVGMLIDMDDDDMLAASPAMMKEEMNDGLVGVVTNLMDLDTDDMPAAGPLMKEGETNDGGVVSFVNLLDLDVDDAILSVIGATEQDNDIILDDLAQIDFWLTLMVLVLRIMVLLLIIWIKEVLLWCGSCS